MPTLVIKYHPKFFKDLDKLSRQQLEAVNKKIERIKAKPDEFNELRGGNNCCKVRIESMRLIYFYDNTNLWFLILDSRKSVYNEYMKRLYTLKTRL